MSASSTGHERQIAAIDIGATKTLVTVRSIPLAASWDGQLSQTLEFRTHRRPLDEIEAIAQSVHRLSSGGQVVAAGCGAPGPLDPTTGIVGRSPNLGWAALPLGPLLAARLGVEVATDDDANLGALGEAVLGAGRGVRSVAYLTLSSGVGAGIVVDGQILRGEHGIAGEVGHLTVARTGPRCSCGRRGHVEALAGGRALLRRAQSVQDVWPRPAKVGDAVDAIFRAARAGDLVARGLIADAAEAVAVALSSLAAVLDPGLIVVGGGIGLGQRRFIKTATAIARRRVLAETGRRLETVPAALGSSSVLAGAAVTAARLVEGLQADG